MEYIFRNREDEKKKFSNKVVMAIIPVSLVPEQKLGCKTNLHP